MLFTQYLLIFSTRRNAKNETHEKPNEQMKKYQQMQNEKTSNLFPSKVIAITLLGLNSSDIKDNIPLFAVTK